MLIGIPIRAVPGHFIFVYTHPYLDGNGRMARFLMNVMLASGNYPWTVIKFDIREQYMSALEKGSVGNDIKDFAKFIEEQVSNSLRDGGLFYSKCVNDTTYIHIYVTFTRMNELNLRER